MISMIFRLHTAAIAALLLATSVNAQNAQGAALFESGPQRVDLIELYTSEGCSSCPPADRWLTRLKQSDRLWKDFVPVAFHVDYWDYIGWEDRFAKPEFTDRQYQYAMEGGSRFVYTPGVFRNGEDWPEWRRGRLDNSKQPDPGNLSLAIEGHNVAVHFDSAVAHDGPLTVTVALLNMNRVSKIDAGENSGKILRHDFVVVDLAALKLGKNAAGYSGVLEFDAIPEDSLGTAAVAWVSGESGQAPLQAVGGYLNPPPQ